MRFIFFIRDIRMVAARMVAARMVAARMVAARMVAAAPSWSVDLALRLLQCFQNVFLIAAFHFIFGQYRSAAGRQNATSCPNGPRKKSTCNAPPWEMITARSITFCMS
jgi:hypothetical protein